MRNCVKHLPRVLVDKDRVTNALPDAERQLQRAVALDPNYYEARFFLGRVLNERGKADAAQAIYEALITDTPTDNQWHIEAERELARLQGS